MHETTGYSPFFLLHAREPTLPIDATLGLRAHELQVTPNEDIAERWEEAKKLVTERELLTKENSKEHYDTGRRTQSFSPGDLVHIRMPTSKRGKTTKFLHPFNGPFRIVRQTSANDWEVETRRGKRDVVNVERLKPYITREMADDEVPQGDKAAATSDLPAGTKPAAETESSAPVDSACDSADEDNEEFFDAEDFSEAGETTPTTAVTVSKRLNTRPGREHTRPRQDDFIYY